MHRRCLENAISVWATDNYKQITIRMTPFVWNEFFHHRGFANPVFQQLRLLSPPWLLPGLAFAQEVFGNAISVWAIENYKQIIIRMTHFVWNVFFHTRAFANPVFQQMRFFSPLGPCMFGSLASCSDVRPSCETLGPSSCFAFMVKAGCVEFRRFSFGSACGPLVWLAPARPFCNHSGATDSLNSVGIPSVSLLVSKKKFRRCARKKEIGREKGGR